MEHGAEMQEIVVFLGPSIDRESARAILDVEYRPPAARGDIELAARHGAEIICLIDGVFFQECAVSHREILFALRSGVTVVGSSSMGALRAAELDTFGMLGVGEIYRAFRDGRLVADDEVALVFDPDTWVPLSEPMVNIRATLSRAEKEGIIDEKCAEMIIKAGRSLYFPDRTYDSVADAAIPFVGRDAAELFRSFAVEHAVDQKRIDAISVLEYVRNISSGE